MNPFDFVWNSIIKYDDYEAHWSLDMDDEKTPTLDVKPVFIEHPNSPPQDISISYPFEEWDEEDWQMQLPLIQTFLELKRDKMQAGLGSGSSWEPNIDVQEADDVVQSFVDHMRYLSREAGTEGPRGIEFYPTVVPEAKAILDKWREASSKHAKLYGGE